MQFEPLEIEGAWLIRSQPHVDNRGSFTRLWCAEQLAQHGLPTQAVQWSQSFNLHRHTLRGMHYQASPHEEAKWVCCLHGAIYDVLLDLRESSKSFMRWTAVTLDQGPATQVFIPKGVAHGFLTLQNHTTVQYAISDYYHSESARGIRWNDPEVGIDWPDAPQIISDRDANFPLLSSGLKPWISSTLAA